MRLTLHTKPETDKTLLHYDLYDGDTYLGYMISNDSMSRPPCSKWAFVNSRMALCAAGMTAATKSELMAKIEKKIIKK